MTQMRSEQGSLPLKGEGKGGGLSDQEAHSDPALPGMEARDEQGLLKHPAPPAIVIHRTAA